MTIAAHIVTPDAAQASDWYQRALGAVEVGRVPLPGGKVMAVAMHLANSDFHIASEFPDAGILAPASIGGTATVLQINIADAQSLWDRAVAAGAEIRHPIGDTFWGELHGQFTDPFGHRWNIAQRLRDVSPEDIAAAAAKAFGG